MNNHRLALRETVIYLKLHGRTMMRGEDSEKTNDSKKNNRLCVCVCQLPAARAKIVCVFLCE